MSDYYQFRDETGAPIDYYQLVNDNNELCEEIERLQQQNQKYKEVIDKAIKYIRLIVSEEEFIETEHYTELLDILKGENDE